MITKEIAKEWIDLAYEEWLHGCENCSHLREPIRQLVQKLDESLDKDDFTTAEHYIDRLVNLSGKFQVNDTGTHQFEMAETLLECALAAYRMNDTFAATRYLQDAIAKYTGNVHCRAVTQWILGCLQGRSPTLVTDAIYNWQSSCEMFETRKDASNKIEYAKWYEYWAEKMKNAIDKAINDNEFPSPPLESEWPQYPENGIPESSNSEMEQGKKTGEHSPPNDKEKSSTSFPQGSVLSVFSIYETIPAGGFGAIPGREGSLEIETVKIDNRAYRVENLRTGKLIKLQDSHRYVVLKVTGNSMNEARINDGDFVLVRVQDTAEDHDIVAVEIFREDDDKATLKEFLKRLGKIFLRPRSTDPKYKTYEFDLTREGFLIRGVALAVFKTM